MINGQRAGLAVLAVCKRGSESVQVLFSEWYRSSCGTDFDKSETASPLWPMVLGTFEAQVIQS